MRKWLFIIGLALIALWNTHQIWKRKTAEEAQRVEVQRQERDENQPDKGSELSGSTTAIIKLYP